MRVRAMPSPSPCGGGAVEYPLVLEPEVEPERDELLEFQVMGPPEPREPERHGRAHDGQRRIAHLYPEHESADGCDADGGGEAPDEARERAGRELADDFFGVFTDVLLDPD